MALDVDVTSVTATGVIGTVMVWGQIPANPPYGSWVLVPGGPAGSWSSVTAGFADLWIDILVRGESYVVYEGSYVVYEGAFVIYDPGVVPEWTPIPVPPAANWTEIAT